MDVATILIAAASAIGTKAVDKSTELAIDELWSAMKSVVKRGRGADSDAIAVIDEVEKLPTISQRVTELGLQSDPEIDKVLKDIEAKLRELAPSHLQKIYNFYNSTFNNTNFS
jgi:hypothetical protein